MVKAVLFDLDGTLLDTKDLIIRTIDKVFDDIFKSYNLTYDEKVKTFFGPPLIESFKKFAGTEEELEEAISKYKFYNKDLHDEHVKPFKGAKKILKFLHDHKVKVGVVSSKSHNAVLRGLKITGIDMYVDVIIGCDDTDEHKPSPKPLLKALEILNIKNTDTVYIGDHPNDILSAKNACIESVLVEYSDFFNEGLSLNPEYVIEELMNIKDLI